MKVKNILFLILVLTLSIVLLACSQIQSLPRFSELEDSIKETILSKDENYNFLDDHIYMDKMKELIDMFDHSGLIDKEDIQIGNLDDDNIPELVVFKRRNPEDQNDEGRLEVYKFNGEKYTLLDSVSMNYDNVNYQMSIGKISENQNGLYINNQVGVHSSITYGFILKDDKLVSILNDKKLNLVSPYPNNEIKDIDNDGILNFSIEIIDPETDNPYSKNQNRIKLWYRWDENDSGVLLKVERSGEHSSSATKSSNQNILNTAKYLLKTEKYSDFIDYIGENKDELSIKDNSELLKKYLSIDNQSTIDYQHLLQEFGDNILKEYRDYLKILSLNSNEPYSIDGDIVIPLDRLAERIVLLENYKMTYPYSNYLGRIDKIYKEYMGDFILGSTNNLHYDMDSYKIHDEVLKVFESVMEKYPHTYLAQVISDFMSTLNNNNTLDKDLISKYNKQI